MAVETTRFGLADALSTLRNSEQVSFILDSSLNLAYHNKAWNRFAQENSAPQLAGGAAIGKNLLCVIDGSLKAFYREAFQRVIREKTIWEWEYECSSPELFRKFLMRVHPIRPSGWLLVTNSVLVESEHAQGKTDSSNYRNADGKILMCVHCRCSKRTAAPERWDFVPANLKPEVAKVTHGLCPICKDYFYPSGQGMRTSVVGTSGA
jgi:hypothetical protein